MTWTYGGLCAGIGMLERACQQLGGVGKWMADIDPFCRKVLTKRFPGETVYADVLEALDAEPVDVIVAGFPCQDISPAGRGAGIHGERSGVWFSVLKVIAKLQPKMVLIENVPLLRSRGLDTVIAGLDEAGYDVEWDVIPAAAVGAAHLRERVFIVARRRGLVVRPVFGAVKKTIEISAKLPRAARVIEGSAFELVPIAPRKTKRANGWSYWVGPNLLLEQADVLPMLPTPTARDDGKSPEAHMAMKSRLPGGPRKTITSLAVLARNGFEQTSGVLWATPTSHPRTHTPRRVHHGVQLANQVHEVASGIQDEPHHGRNGEGVDLTVLGALDFSDLSSQIQSSPPLIAAPRTPFPVGSRGGRPQSLMSADSGTFDPLTIPTVVAPMWPTPTASPQENRGQRRYPAQVNGTRGKHLSGEVGQTEIDYGRPTGPLNPDWVEWLMSIPIGWTDLSCPNDLVTQTNWSYEPIDVPRVAKGIPARADRLKAVGNSVFWPVVAYVLGRALVATNLE